MLVIAREAGASIIVGSADETCLVTVLKIFPEQSKTSFLLNRASAGAPGQLDSRTIEIGLDSRVKISPTVDVTLVDIRNDKVRVGINAPPKSWIHRLEAFKAGNGGDPDDDAAGSSVPRPSSPKPPSLDVRLDEPRADDGTTQ